MRKDWDRYFMDIAAQVSTRHTCPPRVEGGLNGVGAVVVSPERQILATGYNGSIPGTPHCDDVGHMLIFDPNTNRESCVRTVHAEANAICQAAKHGISLKGSTIYSTASLCWPCFKLIASSGIVRIVFGKLYRDERIFEFAKVAGIELVDLGARDDSRDQGDKAE